MFGLSPFEMMVIGVIAVVLFGGNLPDVARKAGGMYREFRSRLNDVQREFRAAEYEATRAFNTDTPASSDRDDDDDEPSEPVAPKFTPPS
ncbi:twin-arginine translocase TatA/TatE family subunit [Stieleria sp. TO1_6]|uniref:Sec-independent protein translocase subunit TatA/TatB n=1 Tax=Stieleria tagensis TaxID=2956795 RepID=UPI00209B281C|nr:twin-arginine translocase TatA/TatE family subunit [Stieleria tagensis]MCO8123190.1 twin-arginine translocase TatA/TatE family subunit [Stieleria tagensis]